MLNPAGNKKFQFFSEWISEYRHTLQLEAGRACPDLDFHSKAFMIFMSAFMGIIAEESIRKVLAATDIVDLVHSYIPLKKAGVSWKGVCPFHNDSHPSMTVSPVRQTFKCFACGEGGDAVSFVQKYESLSFIDAIRKLADRAGIPLIEEQYDPQEDTRRRKRTGLIDIHKMAQEYFHSLLKRSPQAQHARDYLNQRGYGSDMAERWMVGWAPAQSGELLAWAKTKGISPDLLIESGLADKGERGLFSRFRDRLMFPICNAYGECVAFSGRILGEAKNTGKYVNSPETPLFKKSEVVFGLDRARKSIAKKGCVLVCEGQMDVIACHEAGVEFAVAPLGTAFTREHAILIKRQTTNVLLCFDGDKAGMSASDRAFRIMASEGLDISLVDMPLGDDPDSMIKREGRDAFLSLIDQARPFFEVRIGRAAHQGMMDTPAGRSELVREMVELLSHMKDAVSRDFNSTDVATRLGMGLNEMRSIVYSAVKSTNRQRGKGENRSNSSEEKGGKMTAPFELDRSVAVLCELCLQSKSVQELMLERVEDMIEPMAVLPGGSLLKKILEEMPDPGIPSQMNAFMHSLPEGERKVLEMLNQAPVVLNDPGLSVIQACSGLARASLEKQLDAILSRLKVSDLPREERMSLLQKSVDLRQLLYSISPQER